MYEGKRVMGINAGEEHSDSDVLVYCPICDLRFTPGEKREHRRYHKERWRLIEKHGFIPPESLRTQLEIFLWDLVKNKEKSFKLRVEAAFGLLWFYYTKEVRRYKFNGSFTDYLKNSGKLLEVRVESFPTEVKRFVSAELWIERFLVEEAIEELKKMLSKGLVLRTTNGGFFLLSRTFEVLCNRLFVFPRRKEFKQLLYENGIIKNSSPTYHEVEIWGRKRKERGYLLNESTF